MVCVLQNVPKFYFFLSNKWQKLRRVFKVARGSEVRTPLSGAENIYNFACGELRHLSFKTP